METDANPRRRRQPIHQRRDDILSAAFAEFAAHGYHAARTVDIAKRAGISQPYIYALFPDKQALFLACHDRAMDRLRAALFADDHDALEAADAERTLDRVDAAFRDLVGADPVQLMFQLQAHAAASDPGIREPVRARFMAMVDAGVRATGASRQVVLGRLARGLLFSVALALDLPEDYRLAPAAGGETAAPPGAPEKEDAGDDPEHGAAR